MDNYDMRYSYTDEPSSGCNLSNPSAVQVVYPRKCSGNGRSPVDFSAANKHLTLHLCQVTFTALTAISVYIQ